MPLPDTPAAKCTDDAEMIATLKSIETHLFYVTVRLHEIDRTLNYQVTNNLHAQRSFVAALMEFTSQLGYK